MKKRQFALLIIGLVVFTFAAAFYTSIAGNREASSGKLFKKVEISSVNPEIKAFMNAFTEKNGVFTYEDGTKVRYLFLNGFNVPEGEKAPYFSDIKMEVIDNVLKISYNENFTADYQKKDLDNRLLYRFTQPEKVDTLQLFRNGVERAFDSCYVNK